MPLPKVVADQGEGPGPPPLFLPKWGPRCRKNFWRLTLPPLPHLRVRMTGSPPYLKVWIRHCKSICQLERVDRRTCAAKIWFHVVSYRQSFIKPPPPPLSNKPTSLISPPPPFQGKKVKKSPSFSSPTSPSPYYSPLINDRLYYWITTVKLCVDWSGTVYSLTGGSDLFLILSCMTSDIWYLSFSTLYSSSLWGTDTIVRAKFNKHPVSITPPPPNKKNMFEINNRRFEVLIKCASFESVSFSGQLVVRRMTEGTRFVTHGLSLTIKSAWR